MFSEVRALVDGSTAHPPGHGRGGLGCRHRPRRQDQVFAERPVPSIRRHYTSWLWRVKGQPRSGGRQMR